MKNLHMTWILIVVSALVVLFAISIEAQTRINKLDFTVSRGHQVLFSLYAESSLDETVATWLTEHSVPVRKGEWVISERKGLLRSGSAGLAMPELDQVRSLIAKYRTSKDESIVAQIREIMSGYYARMNVR